MSDLEKPEAQKKATPSPLANEDIIKLLQEAQTRDRGDKFGFGGRESLAFNDPFSSLGGSRNAPEVERCLGVANKCASERDAAEAKLPQDQKDELRKLRRDLSAAPTDADRARLKASIEKVVPGAVELNKVAKDNLDKASNLDTTVWETQKSTMPRMIDTRVCHQPQRSYDTRVPVDHQAPERAWAAAKYDSFFKPRPGDEFEARWAQVALESPIVKTAEVLKHLPEMKVESKDWNKLVQIGLVTNGIDVNGDMARTLVQILRPIKSVSKSEGNAFTIERNGTTELKLPTAMDLGAGAKATGLEIGTVKFNLGEGTYPSIKNLEGVKVKLEIPTLLRKVGQIDEEARIREISMNRLPGTGDFEVSVLVDNPIPKAVRWLAKQIVDGVPQDDVIKATLMTLGPDGKKK